MRIGDLLFAVDECLWNCRKSAQLLIDFEEGHEVK